jgi:hypothetical protein
MSGASPSLPVVQDYARPGLERGLTPSSQNINSSVQVSVTTRNPDAANDETKPSGVPSHLECHRPPPVSPVGDVVRAKAKIAELEPVVKDAEAPPFDIETTPVEDDPRLWSAGKKVRRTLSSGLSLTTILDDHSCNHFLCVSRPDNRRIHLPTLA